MPYNPIAFTRTDDDIWFYLSDADPPREESITEAASRKPYCLLYEIYTSMARQTPERERERERENHDTEQEQVQKHEQEQDHSYDMMMI